MRRYKELLELLSDDELADISMSFWLDYDGQEAKDAFQALLAYQNGWLACKERYKINE